MKQLDTSLNRTHRIIHLLRWLSTTLGIGAVIITVIAVSAAVGQEDSPPFFRVVDLPLRVAIVHENGSNLGAELFEELIQDDIGGLLDHQVRARSLTGADAVVFVLEDWNAVLRLPFQEQLSELFTGVSRLPLESAGFGTRLISEDGRQLGLLFVHENALPSDDINCATQMFFNALVVGFDRGEIMFNADTESC